MTPPAAPPDDPSWDLAAVAPPWGDRPAGETAGGGVGAAWAPGALDGTLAHHAPFATDAGDAHDAAARVLTALHALAERSTDDRAAALYGAVTHARALAYADPLLSRLAHFRHDRLRAIGRWLATRAPDREAVKLGIMLLGVASDDVDDRDAGDRDLLLTLGRDEELTRFAADALRRRTPAPDVDQTLLALARQVTGWGRIHLVGLLAASDAANAAASDEVRAWLLRDGYRNDVLWEYTALDCAEAGGLLAALRRSDPDDALLLGAGDLLTTLLARHPAASDIESYEDGAEAAKLYVHHLRARAELPLAHFLHTRAIRAFLDESTGPATDTDLGWPQHRAAIVADADAILARPDWSTRARDGLQHPERAVFATAAEAATALGIDPWEHYHDRVARGEHAWWWPLTRTDRPERIARVVALAESRLPLERLAAGARGAGDGRGPDYPLHTTLGAVLQTVRPFPGLGARLVAAGLRSPLTGTRRVAIEVLAAWPRDVWPAGVEAALAAAAADDPDPEMAARAGRALGDATRDRPA